MITFSSVCNCFPHEDWGILSVQNSSCPPVSTRWVPALIARISTCCAPSQRSCPASILNHHSLNFNFSWCHHMLQVDFLLFCEVMNICEVMPQSECLTRWQNSFCHLIIKICWECDQYIQQKNFWDLCVPHLMRVQWHLAFASWCLKTFTFGVEIFCLSLYSEEFFSLPNLLNLLVSSHVHFPSGFASSDTTSSEPLTLFLFVLHSIFKFPYLYLA